MKYCTTCGTLNDPEAKFCSGCGKSFAEHKIIDEAAQQAEEPVRAEAEAFTETAEEVKEETARNAKTSSIKPDPEPGAFREATPQERSLIGETIVPESGAAEENHAKARGYGIAGFVLGICSICGSWYMFTNIIGLACAIVGMILSKKSKKYGNFRLAGPGRILSIIGLVLSIISIVVWAIIFICALIAIFTGHMDFRADGITFYID